MSDPTASARANRLAGETSPYLLQHAHNPVDWYPWGKEALDRARQLDRPILLSIGYAACHWCHVMERESFESEHIAALMNEHFVPIKVDREERPDLDEIYMAATVAMSGGGGWPMTVFLTPDQKPFFAGTYFPPSDRYGRPGFASLLSRIAELWRSDRKALLDQAQRLVLHIEAQTVREPPLGVGREAIEEAKRQLLSSFDSRWGGFGGAPKFPAPAQLSLLLREYRRSSDPESLKAIETTLFAMKNGGIYDHLAGGFARYSTDERWLVPHFEKMLYDNAQLAKVYLEAFQVTQNPEYARVARETLDYAIAEMQGPEAGFYSATDADSEGEEGKFFVWQLDEIQSLLDASEAERFIAYYAVSAEGNWEGKNILWTPRPAEQVARELGIDEDELLRSIQRARRVLYAERKKRIPPLLDDKVLLSWNALMISALADGYRVLGDRRYLTAASTAARYVLTGLRRPDGGFFRTARNGTAHLDAYLEDYAYACDALIDLYEAGAAAEFLGEAARAAERMISDFWDDESGSFYQTAHGHERLLIRFREGHDGALPNPNAVAARALARLSHHLDRADLRERAVRAVSAYGRSIRKIPRAYASTLAVVDFLLDTPVEVVLAGTPGDAGYDGLMAELGRHYLPSRVLAHVEPSAPGRALGVALPLVEGKGLVAGKAAAYVCRHFVCKAPVTDAAGLCDALSEHRAEAAATQPSRVGAAQLGGAASAEATAAYAREFSGRHGAHGYATLGKTGLTVSRIGFGGYRVSDEVADHRAALEHALLSGVNLIDTSTNYADGESERLVGEVVNELSQRGSVNRDRIVIVSKIGYVQGRNFRLASERERQGRPFPEMVKYGKDIWHCIHPEWLSDQLGRSLDRLRLETLDVCLLHNPEYFLSDARKRGQGPLEPLRQEFYRRIGAAFEYLESEVKRGRIQCYGVSSNTSVVPASDPDATDLARMLDRARAAGGEQHHFRVLQLPMNLFEAGAILEKNCSDRSQTVLDCARTNEVAVLVNRPLNAAAGDALLRLADPPAAQTVPVFEDQRAAVQRLEQEFRAQILPALPLEEGVSPHSLFNWARDLADVGARIESLEQFEEIVMGVISPRVDQVMSSIDRAIVGAAAERWADWQRRYVPELQHLLASLAEIAKERNRLRTGKIRKALALHLPAELQDAPLSQLAILALKSAPGVSSVLVGMRQKAYVDDAVAVLSRPPIAEPQRLFEAIAVQEI